MPIEKWIGKWIENAPYDIHGWIIGQVKTTDEMFEKWFKRRYAQGPPNEEFVKSAKILVMEETGRLDIVPLVWLEPKYTVMRPGEEVDL